MSRYIEEINKVMDFEKECLKEFFDEVSSCGEDEVEHFNEEYGNNFNYYYITWYDGSACDLFGSYNCLNDGVVFHVAVL